MSDLESKRKRENIKRRPLFYHNSLQQDLSCYDKSGKRVKKKIKTSFERDCEKKKN